MVNTRKYTALFIFITAIGTISSLATTNKQHLNVTLPSTDSKKQKSRMRKTTGQQPKKASSYREMDYEELLVAKDKMVASGNTVSSIKYLDQLIKLCDPEDTQKIENHRLQIADLLFADGQYQKASQRYAEFSLLHPGSQQLEYVLAQATKSAFNCTLDYDRDQTKTEETLALAESFLKQDHFIEYATDVAAIRDECINKLIASEVNVCSFYLQRGSLKSAEKRLSHLKNTWLPKCPTAEPIIVALEVEFTVQKDNAVKAAEKNTLIAHNKQKKSMTERF